MKTGRTEPAQKPRTCSRANLWPPARIWHRYSIDTGLNGVIPRLPLPLISLNFYLAKLHRPKKISALATPTLPDSPALRKAYGPRWENCPAKDNINPSRGKQEPPPPRPAPVGAGRRGSGVNTGARGQPGAAESLLVGPAALPGGLRAAANLGAVAPSPPRRARCAHGAAHRCATPRDFSLLTTRPNYGKLFLWRRGGHFVRTIEKMAALAFAIAAIFFASAGCLPPKGRFMGQQFSGFSHGHTLAKCFFGHGPACPLPREENPKKTVPDTNRLRRRRSAHGSGNVSGTDPWRRSSPYLMA